LENVHNMSCQVCGTRLIEIIPGELYRCPVDLLYHHVREKTPIGSLATMPTLLDEQRLFQQFLRNINKHKPDAPANLTEFQQLSPDERKPYLEAFKLYKESEEQPEPTEWLKQKLT